MDNLTKRIREEERFFKQNRNKFLFGKKPKDSGTRASDEWKNETIKIIKKKQS